MCNVQGKRSHGLPGVGPAEQPRLTIRSTYHPLPNQTSLLDSSFCRDARSVHMKEMFAWKELPGGGAALRLTIRSLDTELDIVCWAEAFCAPPAAGL